MTTIFATVLLIAIVISASLILIILNHMRQEKRGNKLFIDFNKVADEFDFFISKQEELGSRIIALDDLNNRLLYFYKTNYKSAGYLVDLNELKTSTVEREYELLTSHSKYNANIEPVLKKIALQLNYKGDAKSLCLTFYVKDTDPISEVRERSAKAIEWQGLISTRLKKQPYIKDRHIKSFDTCDVFN